MQLKKVKIAKIFSLALFGTSLMLTSCGTVIDQHGYVAQQGALEDITIGMPLREVNAILGSPSVVTKANGLSHYYISSRQNRFNLIGNLEYERNVVAVHFGGNKRVKKIANYGLKDGLLFDFVAQTTPTYKKDLNIIQELFGGVGALKSAQAATGGFASGNF